VPRKVIGLDIGTSAVRAAEFQVEHNPVRLIGYGQIGLTPGSVVDGEIKDVHAVADALSKLWDQGGFSEKRVLAGAAGLRVITREIDLPYVPDDEVAAVVQFQAADILPFPLEQTVMTSRPIGEFIDPADGTQRRRILIAAAHRQLIDAMIEAIEQASLQPVGIDLVSSALIRPLGSPATGGYSEAVVSIGAGLTVIAIHQSRRPEFVRAIGTGGNALTSAIASSLDLPFADAEIVKRRLGYPDPQARAAETIAARARTELVAEIPNSLEFFSSQPTTPPGPSNPHWRQSPTRRSGGRDLQYPPNTYCGRIPTLPGRHLSHTNHARRDEHDRPGCSHGHGLSDTRGRRRNRCIQLDPSRGDRKDSSARLSAQLSGGGHSHRVGPPRNRYLESAPSPQCGEPQCALESRAYSPQ
jgi:type IV pilus assembly protein PilM